MVFVPFFMEHGRVLLSDEVGKMGYVGGKRGCGADRGAIARRIGSPVAVKGFTSLLARARAEEAPPVLGIFRGGGNQLKRGPSRRGLTRHSPRPRGKRKGIR
jgi:hypothetical protein